MLTIVPPLLVVTAGLAIVGRALAVEAPMDVRRRVVAAGVLAAVLVALGGAASDALVPASGPILAMLVVALAAGLSWRIPDRMQSWATELGELAMLLVVLAVESLGEPDTHIPVSQAICVLWAIAGALAGRGAVLAPRQRAVAPVLVLAVIAAVATVRSVGPEVGAAVASLGVVVAIGLQRPPHVRLPIRRLGVAALGAGTVVLAAWLMGLPCDGRMLLPALAVALLVDLAAHEPPTEATPEPAAPFEAERETLALIGRLADPLGSAEQALLTLDHVFPGGRIELLQVPDAAEGIRSHGTVIDRELLAELCRRGVLQADSGTSLPRSALRALRQLGPHVTLLPVSYQERIHGVLLVRGMQLHETSLSQARRFADLLGHRLEAQRLAVELQHKQRLATLGTFAAALVHDLRSPLATVRLDIQLLQRSTPVRQQASFADAIAALDRVLDDLSGTLDFTRPLELDVATLDLVELVRSTTSSLQPRAERHDVVLSTAIEPAGAVAVRGDRPRLLRVLENLVRNALEVAPPGSTITVGLVADREGASVTVSDEGPGIDPALRERIFEPFVTTKREGVGLGLAIVRKIVEAHHGRMSVDSTIHAGTRMTMWLPRARGSKVGPVVHDAPVPERAT